MALGDTILKQISKNADKVGEEQPGKFANIKSKAAVIISIFAAVYSIAAFLQTQTASKILNNTIHVNDVWSFYQAKSIKQSIAEVNRENAQRAGDAKRAAEIQVIIDRYETEPGEGKKDLLKEAKRIEAEISVLKKQAPWYGLAGSIMQIAIVLLTASILSTGMLMFWGGIATMAVAVGFMAQGLFLFF